jgi:stalled ribosome rescue protein Dom34
MNTFTLSPSAEPGARSGANRASAVSLRKHASEMQEKARRVRVIARIVRANDLAPLLGSRHASVTIHPRRL